ncbi:MAG: hypothetical protein Kow00127_01210 [Bacteroidales bacterium]
MTTVRELEAFIDKEVSLAEEKKIREAILNDPALAIEYKIRTEINHAINDREFARLIHLLNRQYETSHPVKSEEFQKVEWLKRWQLIAAAITLILLVSGLWFGISMKSASTERLVSRYYKPAQPIDRTGNSSDNEVLQTAFNYYRQNDFKQALNYFLILQNHVTARFYRGICYTELRNYDSAIDEFSHVIEDNMNLFSEQAEWYIGLVYLMKNQKKEARFRFKRIADSESYYSGQAKELLLYLK